MSLSFTNGRIFIMRSGAEPWTRASANEIRLVQ
jgi:hypothetical protein